MEPEALLFYTTLISPFVCSFLFKNPAVKALSSAASALLLMVACVIVGESRARDSDMDIVFAFAVVLWGALAFVYGLACSVLIETFRKLLTRWGSKINWKRKSKDL